MPPVGGREEHPMSSLPQRESRASRLGMLDALRFVAALSVVALHLTSQTSPAWGGPPPPEVAEVGRWTMYGALGVPLFFIISGFVVLMTAWDRDVPNFIASRVGRLFPAYWVAVAFSAVLIFVVWPESPAFFEWKFTKADGLMNFTMLQGAFGVPNIDGPYWTLWYEAKFYLLIALLMMVGITRRRVLAFALLWPLAASMSVAAGQGFLVSLLMPDYAPFFAGGMLLYLIYRDGHDLGTWLLVAVQAVFGVSFATRHYPGLADSTAGVPSKTVLALVILGCFAAVAAVTLTPLTRLNAGWMTALGALTYPLYLIHENLGWYVIHLLHGRVSAWPAVAGAAVAALLAAVLIQYLVERPFGGRLRKATLEMLERTGRPGKPSLARPIGLSPARHPTPAVAVLAATPAAVVKDVVPGPVSGDIPRQRRPVANLDPAVRAESAAV
jgi:peptidoglycan/LPS O-acetylase OafA/YrhL